MKTPLGIVLRSCLFAAVQFLITPPYSLIALGTFPLPALTRYRIIRGWARLMLVLVERICGIPYPGFAGRGFGRIPHCCGGIGPAPKPP